VPRKRDFETEDRCGDFKIVKFVSLPELKLATNFSFSRIISFILTVGNVERWYSIGGCIGKCLAT
jgi:hypothetical protein